MPTTQYPRRKADFVAWLPNFGREVTANAAQWGVPAGKIDELTTRAAEVTVGFRNELDLDAQKKAATRTTNDAIHSVQVVIGEIIAIVKAAGGATAAQMETAGIRPRDTTLTPLSPEAILALSPPLLKINSGRGTIIVHWGPNPGNEHANARPKGVGGCEIQWFAGNAPPTAEQLAADEEIWKSTRPTPIDRVSPFEHEFALIAAPARIWYRARYVDIHLRPGVWSGPADATVSP